MKRQSGVTILEVLLVFAIVSSILVMGIRMYQQYQVQTNLQQIRYNVQVIATAVANYYKANCQNYGTLDPTSAARPITAPPIPSLTTPYSLNITTQLVNPKYLSPWPLTANPLIDATGGNNGYIVQLNPIITTDAITASVCIDNNVPCTLSQTPIPSNQARVLLWQIQIAVKLKNPNLGPQYRNVMGAACLSDVSASGVTPCVTSGNTGPYVVFTMLPSNASINALSVLWQMLPQLNSFNNMYSHDVMYEMNSGYSSPQYYLCGG